MGKSPFTNENDRNQITDPHFESQYVTFEVADQGYGIHVGEVVEIIRMVAMAEAPEAPHYIAGFINIRGRVVPVVDLRRRIRLEPIGYTIATPIVVVRVKQMPVGIIVDRVTEVLALPAKSVEVMPGNTTESRCLAGVAKNDAKLIFILDLEGLFSASEAEVIEELLAAGNVKRTAAV